MDSVSALMSGLVDYAGLFPPASLGMDEAVHNYLGYLEGPDAAWLGSFIVPADRFAEFKDALRKAGTGRERAKPMELSLIASDPAQVKMIVDSLSLDERDSISVKGVELKLDLRSAFPEAGTLGNFGPNVRVYVEIPAAGDVETLIPRVKSAGAFPKLRTGGVTGDSFPSTYHVIRFLRACFDAGAAFKATAGLHHPVRAEFPLTYEPGCARATMYGFLNVFLAAAFLWNGADDATAARILEETDASAFEFSPNRITWRGSELSTNRIAAARDSFAHSFGSCSFREPVDELKLLLTGVHA